ncbi:hypothetical protein N7493_001200 [Penicillium malachiteum]|uniref:Oxidase ustYa n=1 Tax=Penicillium malachiteum TaxID=1324776 RepID=A0AAD6MZL1_9EURO|nr:hypothetical protein N7493_001200 [Penicillium malachiteum]
MPQVGVLVLGSAILYCIRVSVPAWTAAMHDKHESEHDPLVTKELDYSRYWGFNDESEKSKTRRFSLGYFILIQPREKHQHQLDEYGSLSQFNKSWDYSNHSTVGEPHEGRIFYYETWEDMASHHGLVSVTEEWAAQHGLPPSAPTPDTPGELVYQMDGFHAMHCLHMIRENLLENYHFDDHTRHCLDYIRHTLMCNVDVTLAGLDKRNLLGAKSSYAIHTCRDYDAVVRWSVANRWDNVSEWLANNL